MVLRIISLRASTDEVIPQLQRFSASDFSVRRRTQAVALGTKHLAQLTSHIKSNHFANSFLYSFVLIPSLTGEQNIKRRQKDNKKAPTPKGKCSLVVLFCLSPIRRSTAQLTSATLPFRYIAFSLSFKYTPAYGRFSYRKSVASY